MKKLLKSKRAWLLAITLALVLCASVGTALAYFTDYTTASGRFTLRLNDSAVIKETVVNKSKVVTIANTGELDVYVRLRAFAGDAYPLTISGNGWHDGGDGYWYYDSVLPVGATIPDANALTVAINGMDPDTVEGLNVVIVQEYTPAFYDNNGNPRPADWARTA